MNCDDINGRLSRAEPFTAGESEHIAGCSRCQGLLAALAPRAETPASERISRLQQSITSSLAPVRPLPSDRALVSLCVLCFALLMLVIAAMTGFQGFRNLTTIERILYYVPIAAGALLFSMELVQSIVPGSRTRIAPALPIVLTLAATALVTAVLFTNNSLANFVARGIPCLRLGLISAAVSGVAAYFLIRIGFVTNRLRLGVTAGFFCGLLGVAVLALHCPQKNFLHTLVWHLGAMVLAGLAGTLLGASAEKKSRPLSGGRLSSVQG